MEKWQSARRSIIGILRDRSEEAVKRVQRIHSHNARVQTRPVEFRIEYESQYREVRSRLFGLGHRATHGAWVGGTRQQARALARKMARHEIRMQKAEA